MEKNKLSAKTLALFAAAVILLASGGVMTTRSALNIVSPNGNATLETSSVSVQLLEDGKQVSAQSDSADASGSILTSLSGSKLVPGKEYDASGVSVRNNGTADEYVRVIVRKYWSDVAESESKDAAPAAGDKNKTLDPAYIELTTADGWIEADEGGAETSAYYYTKPLKPSGDAVALFDKLRISENVVADSEKTEKIEEKTEGNVKVVTYTYNYADKVFTVEAEVQSVQARSAAEAVRSVWGVKAEISGNGTITSISR